MAENEHVSKEELVELNALLDELERLERIHRAEVDLLFFAHEYFGDVYNPGNSGNWIPLPIEDAPEFHHELCNMMNVISTKQPNGKVCWAAPRGHAKSSYLSKTFPIHQVCYRKRKYTIIISETPHVSTANLAWIADQLKHNEKLRNDFGPLLSPKKQTNDKDNSTEFIAWQPAADKGRHMLCKVEAASTGEALRGRNWDATRPDLIICDDVEGRNNTETPASRKKLRDWFAQYVMPLGDPSGKKTAFIFLGTTVHYDSLLLYVMKEYTDFTSRLFKALMKFPDRMDLWEECRRIYKNKENPHCVTEAEDFYLANKAEMDRGAVVLWEKVKPIWELMTWKWNRGSKAFHTEYQNEPIDEENQVFKPERFFYWTDTEPHREFSQVEYDIYFGLDFAMGKKRGDYSAMVVIAKHRETGVIYVIDTFIERAAPDKFMGVIVDRVLFWQPVGIAAEAQMAQEFFVHKLKQALIEKGYPAKTRVHEIHQRTRKELRIESMLSDIENTAIRFSRRHMTLLEMFEKYGTGYHDDGPDALEMAVSISKKAKKKQSRTRKHLY